MLFSLECSCDHRGTMESRCPEHSPCLCNPMTGQCPCRRGVEGDQCDQCEDGFWDLNGWGGCQPCSCDPEHSMSNICDKARWDFPEVFSCSPIKALSQHLLTEALWPPQVTGQCPCHPDFGGQHCDKCGENYFGSPELQCFRELMLQTFTSYLFSNLFPSHASQLVTVTWREQSDHPVILKLASVVVGWASLESSVMSVPPGMAPHFQLAESATHVPPSGMKISLMFKKLLRGWKPLSLAMTAPFSKQLAASSSVY